MVSEVDLRQIIAETVRFELEPCAVRVNVHERDDGENDVTFIVTVSIGPDCAPDNRKMLGLTRKIREKLYHEHAETGFPVLSFIAKNEELISGLEFA